MEEPRVIVNTPKPATCTCPNPLPRDRATWKGAARTVCDRCGLPIRIDFRL
jgi:hypothetical protein